MSFLFRNRQSRSSEGEDNNKTFFDFVPRDATNAPYPLSQFRHRVVLVVNTASKCGFTDQLGQLEALREKILKDHSQSPQNPETQSASSPPFEILAFPCNQFGSQDPLSSSEIVSFCRLSYKVSFPVLAKVCVNPPRTTNSSHGTEAKDMTTDKADGEPDEEEPVWKWMKNQKSSLWMKDIKWNFEKFLIGKDGMVKGRWTSIKNPMDLEDVVRREMTVELKTEE